MQSPYENARLRIRPYRANDVGGLYACIQHSLPEMMPFLPWAHENYAPEDSQGWVSWAMVATFPVGVLILYLVYLWENPK